MNRSGGQTPGDVVVRNINPKSELHTDESAAYIEAGKQFAAHKTVRHGSRGEGIFVGPDGTTTNAAENFFGNFKRSMKGTYRFCGEQHLQRYLTSFSSGIIIAPNSASLTGNGRRLLLRVSRASA